MGLLVEERKTCLHFSSILTFMLSHPSFHSILTFILGYLLLLVAHRILSPFFVLIIVCLFDQILWKCLV